MIQDLAVFALVAAAIFYLVVKLLLPSLRNIRKSSCASGGCGCRKNPPESR